MKIQVGYEFVYNFPQATPMILTIHVHDSRIGRVLTARRRDAADVAIITTFGPNTLESFQIFTDEV